MKTLCLNFPRRISISSADPRAIVALAVWFRQNIRNIYADPSLRNNAVYSHRPETKPQFGLETLQVAADHCHSHVHVNQMTSLRLGLLQNYNNTTDDSKQYTTLMLSPL